MTRALLLGSIAIVLAWPARALLARARWTALTPRAAIVLWQAIGLTVLVAVVGACAEVASLVPSGPGPRRHLTDLSNALAAPPPQSHTPNELFGLTAALLLGALFVGVLATRAIGLARARAYHRLLLDLVGEERGEIPGALVVDHPRATAYSVPGLRPRHVVSRGAIDALSAAELAAVLAHERAHTSARHDLVLFPFESLAAALPRSRVLATVTSRLKALIEMAADDRALRACEPTTLVAALCTLTPTEVPSADRSSADWTASRAERVLTPHRNARLVVLGSSLSTLAVVALPILALLLTSAGR